MTKLTVSGSSIRVNQVMSQLKLWVSIISAISIALSAGCSSSPSKQSHSYDSTTPRSHKSEKLVQIASSMLGKPYKYGGISPGTGFDCSGLVYYSHKQLGKSLPRTSSLQYRASHPVSRKNLKRGDLLFFRIYRRKISHVGIYLGDNRFIHAPSSGKQVSIAELDSPYWSKRFVRGGRFF